MKTMNIENIRDNRKTKAFILCKLIVVVDLLGQGTKMKMMNDIYLYTSRGYVTIKSFYTIVLYIYS